MSRDFPLTRSRYHTNQHDDTEDHAPDDNTEEDLLRMEEEELEAKLRLMKLKRQRLLKQRDKTQQVTENSNQPSARPLHSTCDQGDESDFQHAEFSHFINFPPLRDADLELSFDATPSMIAQHSGNAAPSESITLLAATTETVSVRRDQAKYNAPHLPPTGDNMHLTGNTSTADTLHGGPHQDRAARQSWSRKSVVTGSDSLNEDADTCHCGKAKPSQDKCFFCWPCNGTIFCEDCWDTSPPHKPGRKGFFRNRNVGTPHEKSDPITAKKIFETLNAERDEEQQALLHVQDEDSAWFGTGKDENSGDTVFRDFGRYSRLMERQSGLRRRTKYPALISFVGQTGAGKSSLIRLLIQCFATGDEAPEVPVVSSITNKALPTSSDVHLYADLRTIEGDYPILYADCEGLDGGERKPMAAQARNRQTEPNFAEHRTPSFSKHMRRQHHTDEREIMWADNSDKKSREYHVLHLYPRLLFTFSDVIVFVMREAKVIEKAIEHLINWANSALETSSNQPVLPHVIIVMNAVENASEPSLWDVDHSTADLMDQVSRAVHQNPKMSAFAEIWKKRGKEVESVLALMLSYFSSIRVVRVVSTPGFAAFSAADSGIFAARKGTANLDG